MARLDILDETARREFERPPTFTNEQRQHFFELPIYLRTTVRRFDTPLNQIGFLLQWGYFQATGRFFKSATFVPGDVVYVARQLAVHPKTIRLSDYPPNTVSRHRQLIRQALGFTAFLGSGRAMAQQEVDQLVSRQVHPEQIFWSLCSFLRTHRIEVPTHFALAELIRGAVRLYEDQIDTILNEQLTDLQVALLDDLLQKLPNDASGRSIHQLARLKGAQELMRLSVIRQNGRVLVDLKECYAGLLPLIQVLDLSVEFIEYYAEYVLRADVFHVKRRSRKYLILLCFVQYQYFHVSDILLQTFLQATELALLQADNERDALILKKQQQEGATIQDVYAQYLTQAGLVRQLQQAAFALDKTREERFADWIHLMNGPDWDAFLKLEPSVQRLYGQARRQVDGSLLHQALAKQARPLMNRVADLLRQLEFGSGQADNPVMQALAFYQQKGGTISSIIRPDQLPVAFLGRAERKAVLGDRIGVSNIDFNLYRMLLVRAIADELKAGRITVRTSHTFKAVEEYLISEHVWQTQKQTLLERAGLQHLEYWEPVQTKLETALRDQLAKTFDTINAGENLFVRHNKKGGLRFVTPKKEVESPTIEFYPKDFYVSIFEVLHTVNQYTQFTGALTHRMEQNQQPVLSPTVNYATLIGWGCNLGLHHMAKTSAVPLRELERATNWYFTPQHLLLASDRIRTLMNQLPMAHLLREPEPGRAPNSYRSSSDGQKYRLALDSIHANYSAKNFGKEKGVTVYSFIHEHYPVFYTTVFSADEYEAWYVLDGLLHNAMTMPVGQIHSTDTHGVTALNFALTYLLGITFQPRIKQFNKVTLYGMPGIDIPQQADYLLATGAPINLRLIGEQWDNIKRFLVSIKLNHALPSTLLRRLTSYSDHHPLYQALRELGKVVRTTFILQYMDEEDTRRRVNHAQTKSENLHQIAAELNLGKNGLIRYASREDLLVMARSKQLLINAMTCWNMLRITQQLLESSPDERAVLLAAIPHTAPLSWKHINFQGEYDFSEDALRHLVNVDLTSLLKGKVSEEDLTN